VKENIRTNDLATLAFAQALLKDADIPNEVFDQHTSMVEGSILAIQRRLLVLDEDAEEARSLLGDAGIDVGQL
jgi:hypothetical protein